MSGVSGTYEIMASVTTTSIRRPSSAGSRAGPPPSRPRPPSPSTPRPRRCRRRGSTSSASGRASPTSRRPAHIVEAAVAACRDPANHHYTPTGGIPALREAIAAKTQARLGPRGRGRPGAGDQRRQAGRGQRLRRPVRPRRRGHRARPVLDDLPRVDRPGRRDARRTSPPTRRRASARSVEDLEAALDAQHQGAALRVAVQPDRGRLPARRDRGHRALGGRARASGCSPTRSTSTSSTAAPSTTPCRCWCPSWPTAAWWPTAWPRPTP